MFQFAILNCISSAPDEGGAGEAYSEGNFALILAEQEFEGSPAAASLMVTGLFLHYRGMPFDGIAQFFKIPLPPASMQAQIDACENSPMKDDPRETIEDGFLELLDAGALSIRLDSETRSLVSRPFPDIVANIVGSIYQAELSDGTGGIPPQRPSFEIESTGSAEVGGFSASVEMPSSFKFTSVSDLTVQWNNADPKSDFMMLKIVSGSGKERQFIRCFVKDDGEFAIPVKLASIPGIMKSDKPLKIYGYRVKIGTFPASGMETGLTIAVKSDAATVF